jgi:acetylglutamate kinase
LSGIDGLLTSALPINPELQFAGRPQRTDGKLLEVLLVAGYVPTVACLAGDAQGNIYNVNADQMAVSCAVGWRADKLLFLTDVPGVKNQTGSIVAHLTPPEVAELIQSGAAHGGMQAKLESAVWALEGGLAEVVVAPGQEDDICARLLVAKEAIGTRISKG